MNSTTAPTHMSAADESGKIMIPIIAVILIITSFVILSVATLASNGIFILTFYKDPLKCLRTPSAIFIAGLTCANFFTGLIVEPAFVTIYVLLNVHVKGTDLAKFYHFTEIFSFITINSSFLIMLAIGIIQHLLIKHQRIYQKAVSSKSSVIGLIFIFVYSIFFAVLSEMTGMKKSAFNFFNLVIHNALLTVVIVILYVMIYFAYCKLVQQHCDTDQEESSEFQRPEYGQRRHRAEKDFVYGTIKLTVMLVIAAWPITVTEFIAIFHEFSTGVWISWVVSFFLLLLKFALDPFVFAWRSTKYRKSMMLVMNKVRSSREPSVPASGVIYRREGLGTSNCPLETEDVQIITIHGNDRMHEQVANV